MIAEAVTGIETATLTRVSRLELLDSALHAARILSPLEWAADLNRLATAAGVTLRELRPDAVDLEEAFPEMTETQGRSDT